MDADFDFFYMLSAVAWATKSSQAAKISVRGQVGNHQGFYSTVKP
jgi:hypothetical protein